MTTLRPPVETAKRGWGLLIGGALLCLYGFEITYGLPNQNITWPPDGDALVPLIFAKRALLDGWNTGWHSPYPDFHRFVLLLFYTPYMLLQYLTGGLEGLDMSAGYPYGVEGFERIYSHLTVITRAVSVAMAVGLVAIVYRVGVSLDGEMTGRFAAVLAACSPATVYYVHTETLDVPMLFWLAVAIYCYVRAWETLELRFFVALAVFAAISTATKDYAYGAFVLLPLPLAGRIAGEAGSPGPGRWLRACFDKRMLIALLVFLFAFALSENLFWNPSGFVNHVRLAAGLGGGPTTVTTDLSRWARLQAFYDGRLAQLGRIMPFVLGWSGFAVCSVALATCWMRPFRNLRVLLWPILSYYVFVIVLSQRDSSIERSFMPLGLLLTFFGGSLLGQLFRAERGLLRPAMVTVLVLCSVANAVAVDVMIAMDCRYQAERWFSLNVEHGEAVEVYGYRNMVPRLHTHWDDVVVNQDESPQESDLQVISPEVLFEGLQQRSPAYIVVAEPYRRTWSRGRQRNEELASTFTEFFGALDDGQLGYARVARFDPWFSRLFGMPEYRRLVPSISVYQRSAKSRHRVSRGDRKPVAGSPIIVNVSGESES